MNKSWTGTWFGMAVAGLVGLMAATVALGDPSLKWTAQFGTPQEDRANAVALDAAGNVYISGFTLGGLAAANKGQYDAYLAKYSPTGTLAWKTQLGTSSYDYAYGVAVDGSGNPTMAGSTSGLLGSASFGSSDVLIASYSSAGTQTRVTQFGTAQSDFGNSLAVDAAGNAYIIGDTFGALGGTYNGGTDTYVAKFAPDGALAWKSQIGTSTQDYAKGVAVDGAGNVYVAGFTWGSLEGVNQGSNDAYLAKFSDSGSLAWIIQFGTNADDGAQGVAVDSAGNILVAGYTYGALGGASAGNSDAFLGKFAPDGSQIWLNQFGSSVADGAAGVAVDGSDNLYVAGYTYGNLCGTQQGGGDVFLAAYSAAGNELWATQLGSSQLDLATGVSANGQGDVAVAGYTLGGLEGSTNGSYDAFVAVYSVPEPATLCLLAIGILGLLARRQKRLG